MLERLFGRGTARIIADGKAYPDRYERFSIRKLDFSGPNVGRWPRWLGSGCSCRRQPDEGRDVLWLCFPGLGRADFEEPFSAFPRFIDVLPKEGLSFVFSGPTAIAGYSPDQCIRVTKEVLSATTRILDEHPHKRVRVFCMSAGTHLGFYVANQLGRINQKPIDMLVASSPGSSIAHGIFSTWVAADLVADLKRRGITVEDYDRAIYEFTQKANMEYLPSGKNLVIHAGTADSFIPFDMDHGTNDIVERLKAAGKNPTYVLHQGGSHVSLALSLMLREKIGCDPHRCVS